MDEFERGFTVGLIFGESNFAPILIALGDFDPSGTSIPRLRL